MSSGNGAGRRRTTDLEVEPEDGHRGFVTAAPSSADEAAADRAMADAERAVVLGTASADQRDRVASIGEARTHEERRRLWIAADA